MAISNLLSASTSSRTGRPRPLSSFGILAIPGGSRFLPRFLFSPQENGSYLGGGEDDLPSGGGGCGIGGEESANASSEDALAKALHEPTKEDNDTVSSCLGSAIRAVGIHSNIGNSNDEIEIIMPHHMQTPQNILQQIANLLSQNARSQTMITNLLEQTVNSQTMITNLLEQTVNSRTMMANLLEQTVNSRTTMANLLEQTLNRQTTMANLLEQTEIRNVLVQMFTMTGMVANISIDDDLVKKRKGLLGFTYTIAEKMIFLYGLLVTFSLTDPHGKVSYDDTSTQAICLANVMSSCFSIVMASFASDFKDSELLVDNVRFEIFIWLLLFELLAFITECVITIGVFTHMNNWVLCPFGITCFCSTALMWAVYYERPQFLNKWIEKMGCFLQGWTANQPEQQVDTGPNHIP